MVLKGGILYVIIWIFSPAIFGLFLIVDQCPKSPLCLFFALDVFAKEDYRRVPKYYLTSFTSEGQLKSFLFRIYRSDKVVG